MLEFEKPEEPEPVATQRNKTELLVMTFKISQIIIYRTLAIALKCPAFRGVFYYTCRVPFGETYRIEVPIFNLLYQESLSHFLRENLSYVLH